MVAKNNVLLIGGTGFIGRNIIDFVLKNEHQQHYNIVVLSRTPQLDAVSGVTYVKGDYTDEDVLIKLFAKYNFNSVFHCATSTTPLSSANNILRDIQGNLVATIVLLDVMKDFGCKFIMYLSSGGAVYGVKDMKTIAENEICHPVSSYGVVKLSIENYLRLYQKQYGINYLILRVSNPFGKFHSSEKQGVINIAIRKALRGETIEVWGDGTQSKDYIYIDDLVQIIFKLLNLGVVNQTINIGSGEPHQLIRILNTIKVHLPTLEVNYVASKSTDVKDFCLDILLMLSLIDFEFTAFEDAIKRTILHEMEQLMQRDGRSKV